MPALTDQIVEMLLPRSEPETILPEGLREDIFGQTLERLTYTQRLIFRWVTSLQARVESEQWHRMPGFQYATYGFIPISPTLELPDGVSTAGEYVFGVALEMEAASYAPFQEVEAFTQGDEIFPVVRNWREAQLHVPYPVAPLGTGACWAHSKHPKILPAADGILTAEHVVAGLPLRSSVTMSNPGSWHLGDRGSCKIDAAIIVLAGCIPHGAMPLSVQHYPLASTDIQFVGVASGPHPITGRITHTHVHPTYLSAKHPMRVFFDCTGIPGDSGALVMEVATGLGVGIYMGSYPISASAPQGGAQALSQAQYELLLDLYV